MRIKNFLIILIILLGENLQAQERLPQVLTFEEYLAFVKQYHPVARQAGLQLSMAEAELLRARGGFDPKIEVDYDRKEFKNTEYYDILNSTFKIPTWYGIELKANFEQNQGVYLNPQKTVPEDGLFSAGVSVDVGQGMFINQRMASLRTARIYRDQSLAERDLMVNEVLYDAALAYFDWLRVYNEMIIYEGFLENAVERYDGIARNARLGAIPAIDTVEARISVQNRILDMEQARVDLVKERLDLSNFLWLDNNTPVELQPDMMPDTNLLPKVNVVLDLPEIIEPGVIPENHPQLRSMELGLRALEVNRRLMANRLLPEINLEYNFLTQEPDEFQSLTRANYKAGVRFSFPLFLRKERGELRLANFRIQDAEFDLQLNERQLENRLLAVFQELESYSIQTQMAVEMVENYATLLAAEERRMSFGESSLFLINTRETRLIEARLKQNDILNKYLYAKARLFRNLGIIPNAD
ncbi:TolC family protein [Antarcticibacterium sp. W02-3]|uniref:TolC family protein n=1 Tax=Antarcticibacterium sp. W02-3 TaxID=2183747 RepID=UPI0020449497|nr:TolC family protein [Antarcticibacterium sp. W02-3]